MVGEASRENKVLESRSKEKLGENLRLEKLGNLRKRTSNLIIK